MEVIALLGTVFVVSFSGVLMPGPVMTVTIAQAVKRGHLGGPMVTLGHGIAEGTLVILMSLGLSQFFQLPLVTGLIGLLGGILLLYMGVGMIRTPAPESLTSTSTSVEGERGPIVAGMIASIANPYWVVWWATIGADFLRRAYVHGVLVIAAFFLVHIAVDLGWNSAMGSAVAAGRRLLTPRIYKGILAVCGTFLLGLGVYFLISGAGTLSQM
ncbi:MAG TPA: LysE family transporter [Chloroflexota bacterium]|nr:LysE family transporter [Chloroflexota bacterium]